MTIQLLGIGSALPLGSLTQSDAARAANQLRCYNDEATEARQLQLLNALYRRSSVQTRFSVLLRAGDDEAVARQTFYQTATHADDRGPSTATRMQRYEIDAPELAEQACRRALEAAAYAVGDIGHLVTVSCSGFNSPGYDLALYPRLGLSPETTRTHVGFMGCHGALNGLRVAHSLAAQDPSTAVLLSAVELCTLHHQYTDDPQQIVANSLFADGAAAVVIRSADNRNGHAALNTKAWNIVASGSYLIPDSADSMSWRIGDNGFCMTLSAQVPELIKINLRPWLESWLARYQLQLDDVQTWAVHPGGPRILSATSNALGLSKEALSISQGVLADYGNMSSPTILFILQRLKAASTPTPCVALAFGPGLVVEALLLR